MAHPFFDGPGPLAIGHRGCAGETPENTLASFARALRDGADVIETDVHLTRDGVPVLIHDPGVERVSDGRGRVCDFDWADLRKLDAGHSFHAEDGSTPFAACGHGIPSLADALAAFPGARFNLEVKDSAPGAAERVLAVVSEAARERNTLLTAEDDAVMQQIRACVVRSRAEVALGASAAEVGRFALAVSKGETPPPGPMALQIPTHFAGHPLVTPRLLDGAHAHGVAVHVWTINDPDEISALLAAGVDGIVSDHPARVVRARAARARA